MISRIRGRLIEKDEKRIILDVGGIFYEVNIPRTSLSRITTDNDGVCEVIIYHYLNMDNNRAVPVLIGFADELEREFFEEFISVAGIGPKAAIKAFDKPVSHIAQAIEEGDQPFLKGLAGIGQQKAKQIIAHLQGKVGRFALIKEGKPPKEEHIKKEVVVEAKDILKRLQYSSKEAESMIEKALEAKPQIERVEDLLNEIYRQRK